MPRITYGFKAFQANKGDGIFIEDPCDVHFRSNLDYTDSAYGLDRDSTGRLILGQKLGSKFPNKSMPVQIDGGFHLNKRTISSSSGTVDADDCIITYDYNGDCSLQLPSASGSSNKVLLIKRLVISNSGTLTIYRDGSDWIENAAAGYPLMPGEWVMFYSDGVTWRIKQRSSRMIELHRASYESSYSTTSGSYETVFTSASVYFTGGPGMMMLAGSLWDDYTSDETFDVHMAVRFGTGTDYHVARVTGWMTGKRSRYAGNRVLSPPAGWQTVDLRWQRLTGAGTIKMSTGDYCNLNWVEM